MHTELSTQEKQDKFIAAISQAIKLACSRLKEPDGTITYENAKLVVADIQRVFLTTIDTVPGNVQAACNLTLASVAPSTQEKVRLLKDSIALFSGITGIAAIIAAVGTALGWGTGFIATTVAWFTGASLAGPIGFAALGVSLTVLAGYFVMKTSSPKIDVFENALIESVGAAIKQNWNKYGDELVVATQP